MVNCDPPAPVGHSTVCIGSDIAEAVMKAFEEICPDLVGAADIDLCNVRVFGTNSRTGRFFVGSDINATAMSAGGAKGVDGWGRQRGTVLRLAPAVVGNVRAAISLPLYPS